MQKRKERNSWVRWVTKWPEWLHASLRKASSFFPLKEKRERSLNALKRKINEIPLGKCHRLWSAYAQTSPESNSTLTESVRVRFPAEEPLSHQFSTHISRARASYSHEPNQRAVAQKERLLGRWQTHYSPHSHQYLAALFRSMSMGHSTPWLGWFCTGSRSPQVAQYHLRLRLG